MDLNFVINCVLLGVGLAMDAFSVSLANGLHDPGMGRLRMTWIAGTFGFFQFLMPMVGWYCVRSVVQAFRAFQGWIPWIALILLGYIGGKMMIDGIRGEVDSAAPVLGAGTLLLQGIATSIDALSVGFTIAEYESVEALRAAGIIAVVTFVICIFGLRIGRRFGLRMAGKATVLGGVILVAIGLEILLRTLL